MIKEAESTQPVKQTIVSEPVQEVKTVAPKKKAEEVVVLKDDSSRLTAKQEWCVDKVTPNFFAQKTSEGEAISPLDQFNNFVNNICPSLNLRVPSKYRKNHFHFDHLCLITSLLFCGTDGVVVSSCFHAGYFLLRTLRPIADAAHSQSSSEAEIEAFKKDFENYVDDFCVNYDDVLPIRTKFVKELNGVEDAEAFQDACFA